MKIKDISQLRADITEIKLEHFLSRSPKYRSFFKASRFGSTLDDSVNINSMLADYDAYWEEKKRRQDLEEQAEYERECLKREAESKAAEERNRAQRIKDAALSSMLITTGYNFEGYRIVKYFGYISGDDVIQVSRGKDGFFSSATNIGSSLRFSLKEIRKRALAELKEAAYTLGCNAIIGVDFDYHTLDPQTANYTGGTTYLPYVFGVTANGTAVIVEKIENDEKK